MNMTNNLFRKKFDFKSIKFRLWIAFIGFALILILLIWCLQIFFLNTYYAGMKKAQTTEILSDIQETFVASEYDSATLKKKIAVESASNDLSIYVIDLSSGEFLIQQDSDEQSEETPGLSMRYSKELAELNTRLSHSPLDKATLEASSSHSSRRQIIGYASYLKNSDGENAYAMYIFAPLVPVRSTVLILRSQLIYITIISIILALALALYLSNRISRPIKAITSSAAKMGKGDYSVKFRGGQYSEINELAETLTRAEGELEKTDMYQKDLIANVSHDLRTPLTMIKSYAEMIRDLSGDNPPKRNAHLSVIIEETDRLNNLVNDMLNLSRMQSRKVVLDMSHFDLQETAEALVASYDILRESEGYHIRFKCEGGPFLIHGDEAKIKQVINNLVKNAIKYCGKDKVVLIKLRRNGKYARFSVTDHGQGIAPDELPHVWERYYKSSTHHVRSTEGSGLGLSIVKEILVLHKARFDVESTPGKGSTFWFELPLDKSKQSAPAGPTLNDRR